MFALNSCFSPAIFGSTCTCIKQVVYSDRVELLVSMVHNYDSDRVESVSMVHNYDSGAVSKHGSQL